MPSHDEGFGLPVAEAVAVGRAVVTSSTGALPEILELPESTFDPTDPADMARVIGAALDDTSLRRRLVDRAIERRSAVTWAAVADRLIRVGDDLVRRAPTRRRSRRHRVALVGPLPPAASGIADHNHRILDALAELVDLEAFVPGEARAARAEHPDVPLYAAADLLDRIDPYGYDAVVCCLGNSSGHEDTLAVCRRLPTVLWLHEVRLPALYLADLHGHADAADRAIPVLRRLYPHRAPETTAKELGWSVQGYADAGLAMTSDLVAGARGVMVSSSLAARMLALDQPPHRPLPPTFVTPLAAPPPGAAATTPRNRERIEVVAVGVVAHHKVPERVIDATAALRRQGRSVRTTFVGPVPDLYADELRTRIEREGVADCVVLAGQVPREAYDRHLAGAEVAVQLRRSSYGETSAAILDALAAGVPVVTNLPSAGELPDGTVELLPPDASSADVAAAVAALADDPARQDERRRAGRAYAASRPPSVLAAEVLAAIEAIQRSA
jgi:glycosyltransferase involved in cell wall biosynthesis